MYCRSKNNGVTLAPLQRWTEGESKNARHAPGREAAEYTQNLLHKTAVAYGIGELLRHRGRGHAVAEAVCEYNGAILFIR